MKAQVDQVQIREVLGTSPGFNRVDFNFPEHSLVIYTANQDGGRDVIHKLSHAGYPAEDYTVEELPDHAERTHPAHH
jgi:hypothetical protein